MRRTLMAATCNAAYVGESEVRDDAGELIGGKAWLDQQLDVCPFEDMDDDTLAEVAERFIGAKEVERIVLTLDHTPVEPEPVYYLCPDCHDEHVLPVEDSVPLRFKRCTRCNPQQPITTQTPAAKRKGRAMGRPQQPLTDEPVPPPSEEF